MRSLLLVIFLFIFVSLACQHRKKECALEVEGICLSKEDFEDLFLNSPYAVTDNLENRQRFLEELITRLVVIKEAERQRVHQQKEFLKSMENFWQQALFKIMVEKKSKEISLSLNVSDEEIKRYYELHRASFEDKGYAEAYKEIKRFLLYNKQTKAMEDWISSLRNKSKVEVNKEILKLNN